ATQCKVVKVESLDKGFNVHCDIEGQAYEFHCRQLVNAAGLGAQTVAKNIEGMSSSLCPPLVLCKGNYFVYEGPPPFNHLIYPVPEKDGSGLGVHATIDLGGQVRFGPDVEYVFDESYDVSLDQMALSIAAIKRYFPGLDERRLSPGYSGIRPKIVAQGEAAADFMIQGEDEHGLPGLVNLFGIESPGLTASLAIAEFVAERLQAGS
ncbi:MAG: L-2-hydroxyglutarate oxidase LhgO, partial [Candidatus Azotimanducaceae bacterium]